jgi:WD40 repeat protein
LVWERKDPNNPTPLQVDESVEVSALAFSPDGSHLAFGGWKQIAGSGGLNGYVGLWAAPFSGDPVTMANDLRHAVASLAFSPDGQTLAVGTGDEGGGGVHLGNMDTLSLAGEDPLAGLDEWTTSVAFQQDGKRLAATGAGGSVRLWSLDRSDADRAETSTTDPDANSGQPTIDPAAQDLLTDNSFGYLSAGFDPDGTLLTAARSPLELWSCG